MARIRLLYMLIGGAMGVLYPFVAVLFGARGLAPSEFGLVAGLASLAAIAAAPVWGHVGDLVTGRRIALIAALAVGASAIGVVGVLTHVLLGVVAYLGFILAMAGVMPMAEAHAVNAIRGSTRPAGAGYGSVRLFLSLAYALTSIPAGFVFNFTGYDIAPVFAAALFAAAALVATSLPDPTWDRRPTNVRIGRSGSIGVALRVEPRLLPLLVVLSLGMNGALSVVTFLPLRIEDLGGRASDVALASGVESLAEVPGFVLAGWLAGRLGLRWLYVVAGGVMTVCLLLLIESTTMSGILALRLVMGIAFGGMMLTGPVAISRYLPAWLQGSGHAIGGVTGGVTALLFSVMGGRLYDLVGPGALFLAGAAACGSAALAAFALLPERVRIRPATSLSGPSGALP